MATMAVIVTHGDGANRTFVVSPLPQAGACGQKGLPWGWRCGWTWSKEVG